MSSPLKRSRRGDGSPFKLRIHSWTEHLETNIFCAVFAQTIAVMTDPIFWMMGELRAKRAEHILPGFPEHEVWLGYYGHHTDVLAEAVDACPTLFDASGADIRSQITSAKLTSAWVQKNPGVFGREYTAHWKQRGVKAYRRHVLDGLRDTGVEYKKHLREMQQYLADDWGDEKLGWFEKALSHSPGLLFFVRVTLPCLMAYRTLPGVLMARARRGGRDREMPSRSLCGSIRW